MTPTDTRLCKQCGVAFISECGRILGRNYCSVACAAKYRRRQRHPERFAPRKCELCGNEYLPSVKATTTQRCCSEACGKKLAYLENKAHYDAYRGEYSKHNREKQRRYYRASLAKRPDYYRELKRIAENRRRLRVVSGTHTPQQWEELKIQYKHKCLRCGDRKPLTEDHVLPLIYGGNDSITNIQPLCRPCNTWKHVKFIDYR